MTINRKLLEEDAPLYQIKRGQEFFPGKVLELELVPKLEPEPHTHVFDSAHGVIAIGFTKKPIILGLRCSCGDIRLL